MKTFGISPISWEMRQKLLACAALSWYPVANWKSTFPSLQLPTNSLDTQLFVGGGMYFYPTQALTIL